jgi:uncharacterized SAM-binding protein YcdF (DUF218 family)
MSGASVLWGTVRQIAIAGAALFVLCIAGLIWFASAPSAGDRTGPTDAIVVLTGGGQRLNSGIALLRDGKGQKLFVSGVNPHVHLEELLRSSGDRLEAAHGWASCCVVLGYQAVDTLGNASETAQWMRQQGFHSLRLVTAWYHMRRSLLEFDRAMPEIEIVPHPVFPDELTQKHWWMSPGAMLLLAGEYGKYLAALLRPVIERLQSASALRSAEAEIGR